MKLYEIKDAYLRLLEMDLDEETLKDTLESLDFDLEEKADNIACIVKSLEIEAEAITEEAKKLMMRARTKQQKAESLKEYLFMTFKSVGKDNLETARNVLKIKKNPSSVQLDDDFETVALNYNYYMNKKTVATPDKEKIKEDLKNGVIIKGAKLIQSERLEIK